MKDFAGSGKKGALDGLPFCARFNLAKGIAVNSKECCVCDVDCIRVISTKGIFLYSSFHFMSLYLFHFSLHFLASFSFSFIRFFINLNWDLFIVR